MPDRTHFMLFIADTPAFESTVLNRFHDKVMAHCSEIGLRKTAGA